MTDTALKRERIVERTDGLIPIEVNDIVRSYDFEFREDCYAEGIVTEIGKELEGCPRYSIKVFKRVFEGKELPEDKWLSDEPGGDMVFPPVNGTPHIFGGFTNFVEKVDSVGKKEKPKVLKRYIIFWERIANSGVIGPVDAVSPEEAVEKYGYRTEFVKHTVIQVPKRAKLRVIGIAN